MKPVVYAGWPAPPGVRAFTTTRHGAGASLAPFDSFNLGNRYAADGDDPATVERNRAELIEHLALPSAPHWLRQVHGVDVLRVSAPPPAQAGGGWEGVASASLEPDGTPPQPSPAFAEEGAEPVADASVTSVPGVVLAILTADCLPVIFTNEKGTEIGAAHAGWRGLANGILENTVAAMHSPARELIAWLGPAAGPQAYEIGAEVFDAFVSQDENVASAFVATRLGHWRVDLYALARQRMAKLGIVRVHGGDLCTISDPQRFYSHRRDARTGRMATVVWMQA
ncbi:peptidoglycan editing factor PgeF [Pseudoxanthomonas sacheonensis]|uniref:Purine nucleoside phosphorylase n=1 Tax=Pseudoxanthomonas sacheonensis TaxID=443615 RepID=A0ABU1RWV7_9GAMM|nr:peptidoglycan editing factor PgeF [Pseudoxanthomonas sacheonensis]MDR6843102.1 YfiH family protein [Pseudoxanthomonas sacheonensis]